MSAGGADLLDLSYNFGLGRADNGDVLIIGNLRNSDRTQFFAYDALNRVVLANSQATSGPNCWGQAFGYDPWGNLTSISSTEPQCSSPVLDASVNANNQFTVINAQTPAYDAAGEMTADGAGALSHQYTWDAEGRMANATTVGVAATSYTYDGGGRRVEKSSGTLYWYGTGGEVLAESDLAGNITEEYIFFDGKRIARVDSSGNVDYYLGDSLGSARVVANSSGTILDDCDFLPYGNEQCVASSSGNNYKFDGMERDPGSGLDHTLHRQYSSNDGRWLSPDPGGIRVVNLENPPSWNMYAYVLENPATNTDPSGEACVFGVTIFGSLFGGRCADDTPPPPPPPPPGPPQGSPGTPTYNLVHAQDQARTNPAFQPNKQTGVTHCNQATCSIASQTGTPTGPLTNSRGVALLANQQAQNLLHSGEYHVVTAAQAQALANQGKTVFAVQPHTGHGHIATVRPNNTYFAPYENADPRGSGPVINNIGARVDIVPQSRAFLPSAPVTYIAPNNPDQ